MLLNLDCESLLELLQLLKVTYKVFLQDKKSLITDVSEDSLDVDVRVSIALELSGDK